MDNRTTNLPTLYAPDSQGRVKEWSVWTIADTIYVEHGLLDGKKQIEKTVCCSKNVGRSNETTPDEQAVLEAQSKWNKQYDKDYRESVDDVPQSTLPNLAHKYQDKVNVVSEAIGRCGYVDTLVKLDGCFSRNMRVWTNKGLVPIGEIVDKKLPCKVWSYNEDSSELEMKPVVSWFNNGKSEAGDFMTITPSGGRKIICLSLIHI